MYICIHTHMLYIYIYVVYIYIHIHACKHTCIYYALNVLCIVM